MSNSDFSLRDRIIALLAPIILWGGLIVLGYFGIFAGIKVCLHLFTAATWMWFTFMIIHTILNCDAEIAAIPYAMYISSSSLIMTAIIAITLICTGHIGKSFLYLIVVYGTSIQVKSLKKERSNSQKEVITH